MKRLKTLWLMIAGIVIMMPALTSCGNSDAIEPEIDWSLQADHTLLMYLIGDNNLSASLETNVSKAHLAVKDSVMAGSLNLVVMKDNDKADDRLPKLYWIHRNAAGGLDTVMIKQWDVDVNMASPEMLAEAMDLTFSRFNTKVKGLQMGSHSRGWVPQGNNNLFAPQRRSFGYDQTITPFGSIELWDMGYVLKNSPKLDYILLDGCNMSNIEVLYELRNVARYIVACPSEMEGEGLPYENVVTALSRVNDDRSLIKALDYSIKCYYNSNKANSTISLLDLSYMDEIAACYKELLKANSGLLKQLSDEQDADKLLSMVSDIQYYGRYKDEYGSRLYNRYYYFDMGEICNQLSANDPTTAKQLSELLQKTLISGYHTNSYRGISINTYSGISVSIPEIFHIAEQYTTTIEMGLMVKDRHFYPFTSKKLLSAYHHTAWGQYMGY